MGCGVGGWGFGGWGLGPTPKSPIPNPQSPIPNFSIFDKSKLNLINIFIKIYKYF
jgi:hypothetical protein